MTMLGQALIGSFLTLISTLIHALCTSGTLWLLARIRDGSWQFPSLASRVGVISTVVVLMVSASILESAAWATAFLLAGVFEAFEPALYFSIVTYTTLGYGDVVLPPGWRLLGALEAANGIVMFGWTTALVIAVVQRVSNHPPKGDE